MWWAKVVGLAEGSVRNCHFTCYITNTSSSKRSDLWYDIESLCGERVVVCSSDFKVTLYGDRERPEERCESCYRVKLMQELSE